MGRTKVYEDREFVNGIFDDGRGKVYHDVEFHRCTFRGGAIFAKKPKRRSTLRNARFVDCTYAGVSLESCVLEDVVVDGLKTTDVILIWGMVYRHVILRGKIGSIKLDNRAFSGSEPEVIAAFEEANAAFYQSVDWALDISQAEFKDFDTLSIPASLVRRDPETQAIVRRAAVLKSDWPAIRMHLERTYWQLAIQDMLDRNDPDCLLVAPKRSRQFVHLVEGIRLLRKAGVAEPD